MSEIQVQAIGTCRYAIISAASYTRNAAEQNIEQIEMNVQENVIQTLQ